MVASIGKGNRADYYAQDRSSYYTRAVGLLTEPPGIWHGRGLRALGLEPGREIDNEAFNDLFGKHLDPQIMAEVREQVASEGLSGKAAKEVLAAAEARAHLGAASYRFKSQADRLSDRLAAYEAEHGQEPDSTARGRIEIEVSRTQRSANTYVDVTFSAPKSWSILWAGYLAAGEVDKAAAVERAWMEGVDAALDYLQEQAGYSRLGHNGVRSVPAEGLIVGKFLQHTSRADDPQLHVHCPILLKVQVRDTDPVTGAETIKWRALDAARVYAHTRAAGAISERVSAEAGARRGFVSEWRGDGKAMEIRGISGELRESFSTGRHRVTEQVGELAAAYEAEHGRPPGAHQLAAMSQYAAMKTREHKTHLSPEQLLGEWERHAQQEVRARLSGVPVDVERHVVVPTPFDPERVMREAVEAVQARRSAWTRQDLLVEVSQHLPGCLGGLTAGQVAHLVDGLTDGALAGQGPVDLVELTAPELLEIPVALQPTLLLPGGRTVYSKGERQYATAEQLSMEQGVAEAAGARGGPALERDRVIAVMRGAGLNPAQAEAVLGIATSGRKIDTLIGPAGAGKSRAVSVLAEAWTAAGRKVLGVASSQRASMVLGEEGITNVTNVSRFLRTHDAIEAGMPANRADVEACTLPPNSLVMLDESNMTDTADIARIRRVVEAAGAKLLLSGDDRQLGSVGAGGMLSQLVDETANAYHLEEVLRFSAWWEREASLGIRDADVNALAEYWQHGRIRSGSGEAMRDMAYRTWLADHRDGYDALLIAGTNAEAGELSMRARDDLVRLGKVQPHGVALGHNTEVAQVAGVGDRVMLRQNDRKITTGSVSGGPAHWAVNRDVVTVTGLRPDGGMTVAYPDGTTMLLSSDYVQTDVELAYAATVHAAEGVTVDRAHLLLSGRESAEQFYPGLSRGRDGNWVYIACDPDDRLIDQDGRPVVPDWRQVATQVMDRSSRPETATMTLRGNLERAESLATLAGVRDDILDRAVQRRYGLLLDAQVGGEAGARIRDLDTWGTVVRQVRGLEADGLPAQRMLAEALVDERGFDDAEDIGKVLHHRIKQHELAWQRAHPVEAEQLAERPWRTYTERSPHVPGDLGMLLAQADKLMDERVERLGARAVDAEPLWALERLGPVPDDPLTRQDWQDRASTVEAYREAHGYACKTDAIGPMPAAGAVEKRQAWIQAYQALGGRSRDVDYSRWDDQALREKVNAYEREKAWAPEDVSERQRRYAERAQDLRVQASRIRVDHGEAGAAWEPQARERENTAARYQRMADALDERGQAYDAWREATERPREEAERARVELRRRDPEALRQADERRAEQAEQVQQARRDARMGRQQDAYLEQHPEQTRTSRAREVIEQARERLGAEQARQQAELAEQRRRVEAEQERTYRPAPELRPNIARGPDRGHGYGR